MSEMLFSCIYLKIQTVKNNIPKSVCLPPISEGML